MSVWRRHEQIGDYDLYLGDCLEIIPTLGPVDAVVTDPPYGVGVSRMNMGNAKKDGKHWDDVPVRLDKLPIVGGHNRPVIVWGGNYFGLPASGKWLVWDKKNDPTGFADCELAWTNLEGVTRIFRWLWSGPYQQKREERFHPTQKPVALMEWCIGHLPPSAQTILDPFAGSGSTGVACVKMGRRFIGIERDPDYFEIMCRRIDEAHKQPRDMFAEPILQPVQESLL